MKLAIILLVLFVLATVWGAQSVYIGLRDRTLVEISCADYVAHPPKSRWIKLVDCEPDFSRTLERTENGNLDATFVPLRPRGVFDGPARLVVETDDERLQAGTHVMQGMMRIGFLDDAADSFRDTLARETGAEHDAVILSLGGTPHMWLGLLSLIGGLGGLTIAGLLVRRRFRR